jgi:Tol biopolymer transport system component
MANVADNQRTLMTLPTEGGMPHELYRGDLWHPTPFVGAWTKDGQHIIVGFYDGQAVRLVAIPAEGGEPRNLNITMQDIQAPAVSPDGRRIAFTGTRSKSELWVIHNLLPELRAGR